MKILDMELNIMQRVLLAGTALILLAMLLFPPYQLLAGTVSLNEGYHFILSADQVGNVEVGNVNVSLLVVQITVVLIASGIGLVLLQRRNHQPNA